VGRGELYIETHKKRNESYVNEEARSIAVSLVKVFISSYNFAICFHSDFYILLQYTNFSFVFCDWDLDKVECNKFVCLIKYSIVRSQTGVYSYLLNL